jgi:hypothetical protein
MTYREPAPPAPSGDDPDARLRARAAEGRQQRERVNEAERSEHEQARARASAENLRDAVVVESLPFIVTVAVCMGVGAFRCYALMRGDGAEPFIGLGWFLGGAALAWASRHALGLWRVPRELAYVRALPFDARGYLANLEAAPSRSARVTVTVELTSKPSAATLVALRTWAAHAGAEVDDAKGRAVTIRRKGIVSGGKWGPTNASVWQAQRRIVERVLRPLHEREKIRSVTFAR